MLYGCSAARHPSYLCVDILGEQMCLGMSCGPVVTHLLFPDPRAPPQQKGRGHYGVGDGPWPGAGQGEGISFRESKYL